MSSTKQHIGALIAALTSAGLGIRLNSDGASFRDFYCRMAGHEPASPLDATFVRLDDRSFFWLQIFDSHRNPIGCGAGRLVLAPAWRGGLRKLMASQSLFIDRAAPLWSAGTPPETDLSGRLGYVGGGWIKPSWRRHGLIGIVIQLVHAYMVEQYRTDHNFGFVRPNHIPLALGDDGYAFAEAGEAFKPIAPAPDSTSRYMLCRPAGHNYYAGMQPSRSMPLRGDVREMPGILPEKVVYAPLSHEDTVPMRKVG